MRKHAFTLIELLVVVSIIALLVAILLPAVHNARLRAKEAICMSDMRSLSQASLVYAVDSQGLLPDLTIKKSADIINPKASDASPQVYWAFTYWRLLFENNYGIQRDQWYSPTAEDWNLDKLYWWIDGTKVGSDTTSTYTVIGRMYMTSLKGNGLDAATSHMFNYLIDPLPDSAWPLFPRRLSDRTHWSLMWADLNRELHSYTPGHIDWSISYDTRIGASHLYGSVHEKPAGTHEAFIDGSGKFVTGEEFQPRSAQPGITFWW